MSADALVVTLAGYEGPLDLLLEMARAQKVDLAAISILTLVEQYLAVIEGARRVRLELAADWLVMAAWLAWLKSRLLLPKTLDKEDEGELAAGNLAARLGELQAIRTMAAWLHTRPRLGHDVFARGMTEDHTVIDDTKLAATVNDLLRAYLAGVRRGMANRVYRPTPVAIWSVKDALARLQLMVGGLPDWTTLEQFLPEGFASPLERRAALASTLIAGLEMAKGGAVALRQDAAFGPILLRAETAAAEGNGNDGA